MKRGRPSRSIQRKIKKKIFTYYEKGISAFAASKDSGINYKTILKYYNTWDNEIHESEEKDFLLRTKKTKERTIQRLDTDIILFFKEEERIEIQKEKALSRGDTAMFEKLSRLKLKTVDQRMKTMSAKMNLIGTPTADTIIAQEEVVA